MGAFGQAGCCLDESAKAARAGRFQEKLTFDLVYFGMISPVVAKTLTNMLPADFGPRISLLEKNETFVLPVWAASMMWLGAWCRSRQLTGKRLIVFAVLPTREFATAFASLGCIVAGASVFEDSLSWPKFKKMPTGHGVFWIHRETTARYGGEIQGFKESEGAAFIVVKVTKAPRRAEVGTIREISEAYFDGYRFTEEKPPSLPKAASLVAVEQSLESLVANLSPKWIWADGAEGLIVTSVASFENAVADLSLSIDRNPPITFLEFLCLGRNKGQAHAKLRFDHPRGALEGGFPLAILDGSKAFMAHEHLAATSNMLVILDRSEYQENIHNSVLSLRSVSCGNNADFLGDMPDKFVPGMELAAYLIDA